MPDEIKEQPDPLPSVIATILPGGAIHVGTSGDVDINSLFVIAGYLVRIANKSLDDMAKSNDKRPRLIRGGTFRRES